MILQAAVRVYYQQFEEQETQSLVDQKVQEYLQRGGGQVRGRVNPLSTCADVSPVDLEFNRILFLPPVNQVRLLGSGQYFCSILPALD
jgi:hypothetical protein